MGPVPVFFLPRGKKGTVFFFFTSPGSGLSPGQGTGWLVGWLVGWVGGWVGGWLVQHHRPRAANWL